MTTYNLATLNSQLAIALRDTTNGVWASSELDSLITTAVASLPPRYTRPLDPRVSTSKVTLVSGTYFYTIDTSVRYLSRVDLVDSGGIELGPLNGSAWEVVGDLEGGAAKLHVSPLINDTYATGYVSLVGYGIYNVTTNLITDDLAPLVLAQARAEAYRRMAGNRVQSTAWLARNQGQNVSVNELITLINEADNEIRRLTSQTTRTWQKPVPGRQG